MIISHKNKYVYVLLPHTAGTAIAAELCEYYGGERILSKHATYHDFLKVATPEERSYRVFSAIRNPLDEAVSVYFKYKTDHNRQFSRARSDGSISVTRRDLKRYDFIKSKNASLARYLSRFYRLPFDNWSRLAHHHFDLVLRFETLQEDFSQMLEIIGVQQLRPLPSQNATGGREETYLALFTEDTIGQARRVFGPFMRKWGYGIPAAWHGPSWWGRIEFAALGPPRYVYWRFIRTAHGRWGRLVRKMLGLKVNLGQEPR